MSKRIAAALVAMASGFMSDDDRLANPINARDEDEARAYLAGRPRKMAAAAAKRKRRGAKRLADRATMEAGR